MKWLLTFNNYYYYGFSQRYVMYLFIWHIETGIETLQMSYKAENIRLK